MFISTNLALEFLSWIYYLVVLVVTIAVAWSGGVFLFRRFSDSISSTNSSGRQSSTVQPHSIFGNCEPRRYLASVAFNWNGPGLCVEFGQWVSVLHDPQAKFGDDVAQGWVYAQIDNGREHLRETVSGNDCEHGWLPATVIDEVKNEPKGPANPNAVATQDETNMREYILLRKASLRAIFMRKHEPASTPPTTIVPGKLLWCVITWSDVPIPAQWISKRTTTVKSFDGDGQSSRVASVWQGPSSENNGTRRVVVYNGKVVYDRISSKEDDPSHSSHDASLALLLCWTGVMLNFQQSVVELHSAGPTPLSTLSIGKSPLHLEACGVILHRFHLHHGLDVLILRHPFKSTLAVIHSLHQSCRFLVAAHMRLLSSSDSLEVFSILATNSSISPQALASDLTLSSSHSIVRAFRAVSYMSLAVQLKCFFSIVHALLPFAGQPCRYAMSKQLFQERLENRSATQIDRFVDLIQFVELATKHLQVSELSRLSKHIRCSWHRMLVDENSKHAKMSCCGILLYMPVSVGPIKAQREAPNGSAWTLVVDYEAELAYFFEFFDMLPRLFARLEQRLYVLDSVDGTPVIKATAEQRLETGNFHSGMVTGSTIEQRFATMSIENIETLD